MVNSRCLASLLVFSIALVLAGCEAEPTPLPVMMPTATDAALGTTAPGTIRYALTDAAANLVSEQEIESLFSSGTVTIVGTSEETLDYDVAIATQPYPDGGILPRTAELAVEINASEPPLDDPDVITALEAILSAGGDPTSVRESLANAGYPDGVTLFVAAEPPTLITFINSLTNRTAGYPVHIQETSADNYHLLLRLNTTMDDDLIPLETMNLYYRAASDVTVTISPNGLPVASR